MHESEIILTLTASLAAALLFGFVTQRIGLSPIVGYLLAGLIVGPYTPGFVANRELADQFAEIGVILLMFGVGLHFHLSDLIAVRNIAIIGAICQSAVATALGAFVGRSFGWSWSEGLVFGIALSVASTVVLTRVLMDNHELHTPTGRIAIGWLVVEDIFTILVLVLLPAVFSGPEASASSLPAAVIFAVLKIALLVAFAFVLGGRLIPRMLNAVSATGSRELFTLTVLVLALGIAVGSATLFGASMALGAFLAGMIVGQSEFSFRAASEALPMRDAFAVLFFVSVGMLFDPAQLAQAPLLLLATLAIVIVGKPLAAFSIVLLLGYGSRTALAVAFALAQIGEFSLILATAADQLDVFPAGATNAIVAAAIVSIMLNPIVYRLVNRLEAGLAGRQSLWRRLNAKQGRLDAALNPHDHSGGETAHTIVVGYGPVGRTVARLLRDGGIEPVIIEMNLDTVRRLRQDGYGAVYGDAARGDVLDAAGIRNSLGLVISGPIPAEAAEIIRMARTMNPNLQVLARSDYLNDTAAMHDAGANRVFSGEGEVALAMTEYILQQLGSSPEQIDRERRRVREEVFGIDKGR
jgi:CPA2 family monovalent cation:H+ antiporter-2